MGIIIRMGMGMIRIMPIAGKTTGMAIELIEFNTLDAHTVPIIEEEHVQLQLREIYRGQPKNLLHVQQTVFHNRGKEPIKLLFPILYPKGEGLMHRENNSKNKGIEITLIK